MDDSNNEQRPRASLRGKGREILLGKQADIPPTEPEPIDAASLNLTPEESDALLNFSPDAPVYDAAPLPAVDEQPLPEWMLEEPDYTGGESLPLHERPEAIKKESEPVPASDDLKYVEPEVWFTDLTSIEPEPDIEPHIDIPAVLPREQRPSTRVAEHEGGLVVPKGAVVEGLEKSEIVDPFQSVVKRQASEELFRATSQPDKELLETLVDDERLKTLWQQIDALHEELVQTVQGDRGATDVYQQELLQASSLLLESRANYDDARAIVYRIRADMNRQRKVNADVMRYRPLLLNYYVGCGIAWVVLFALKGLFTGVAEAVGIDIVSAIYHPSLFGVLGALISGYFTLERHTTTLRDFDPMHISWYLFNPLLGGVMGLMMFLLYAVINDDVLQESASNLELAIAWILCTVAGMNQNNVLRQMNDVLKRFGKGRTT